jgi:hypothetical protein
MLDLVEWLRRLKEAQQNVTGRTSPEILADCSLCAGNFRKWRTTSSTSNEIIADCMTNQIALLRIAHSIYSPERLRL